MQERWKSIKYFQGYSVSNHGRVRTDKSERILAQNENQYGLVYVGMVQNGIQKHRSVPLLVARAFIRGSSPAFDTPINKDGNRFNNHVDNLAWRPRWFAIQYHRQFRFPYDHPINLPLVDVKTGEVSANSFQCAMQYGLLEREIVFAINYNSYVWPTYQEFVVLEE